VGAALQRCRSVPIYDFPFFCLRRFGFMHSALRSSSDDTPSCQNFVDVNNYSKGD